MSAGPNSISERGPVKYVSFADAGGYAAAAFEYMLSLRESGVRISWTPLFPGVGAYIAEPTRAAALGRLRDSVFPLDVRDLYTATLDESTCDVCVLHTVPELWPTHRLVHGRHVGYTVWETDSIPPHWPALLNSVDRLMVPSRFSATVFTESNVRAPIEVVPHIYRPPYSAVDGARFRDLHGVPADHTLFYTIGAWTARKAIWRTLHAFCSAFTSRDAATLLIKTSPLGPAHEGDSRQHPVQQLVRDLVANYPDAPRVCLVVRDLSQTEMDDLHAAGDCYVSLTHAEGWGLGAFDAACASRPVVMTGWGGHLDYLSESESFLVRYQLEPVRDRRGAPSYRRDQRWALADLDDAIDRMRWVHDHRSDAAARADRLGSRLRSEFARDRIIQRFIEVLGV